MSKSGLIFTTCFFLALSFGADAVVSAERLMRAGEESQNWLSHGRNYQEDRESPLTQITPENISELGLSWYFDTGTRRGLEATPLIVDGVMYTTGSWSKVYALNAKTGELLWFFDPQVPKEWGVNACCDVVNRGVAAWGDRIFVGTLDGRLIALNRKTGNTVWDISTIDKTRPYTITGAPRAIKGIIVIGNGGADYGVRGYLSGYSAETGELLWRFFTVPGNPAESFESPAMEMAAKTWTGDLYWQVGGGGTVWDSMAYDPDLDLLYFGVGNGSPWNRNIRSPQGGDNLFLSSIVAVKPETGDYVWHYQTTPADSWDYTATQHIILADLTISGEERKVLLQAPKNGFFYVLDRETGELISAEKYTNVNWASHVDLATGRPVETEVADHSIQSKFTSPASTGGHNWQPMALNHDAGLVYIPTMSSASPYSTAEQYQHRVLKHWNTGQKTLDAEASIPMPPMAFMRQMMNRLMTGQLIAWDPVKQTEVWRVEHSGMWNGGVLTTKSGIVFQGTGDGTLVAYDAKSGAQLWQALTRTGIVAPPVSYAVDGEQYIAVMAGWGGVMGLMMGRDPESDRAPPQGRVLVYKLGGDGLLPSAPSKPPIPPPPAVHASAKSIAHGAQLYNENCARCHGLGLNSSGGIADLRYMSEASHEAFQHIVLGGILSPLGMAGFGDVLSEGDAKDLHQYIISASTEAWEEQGDASWWKGVRNWLYGVAGAVIGSVLKVVAEVFSLF